MGKLQFLVLALVLMLSANETLAKSIGKFKKYYQVTDKEVLIETNKGEKIIITAFNNYAIGVRVADNLENSSLISPSSILKNNQLTGSIYVEELDEMIQVNTTASDGIIIKITKNPFSLSYVCKNSNSPRMAEMTGGVLRSKGNEIIFKNQANEKLSILSYDDLFTLSKPIFMETPLLACDISDIVKPNNEVCIDSSEGYAIVFQKNNTDKIELTQKKGLVVTNRSNTPISYLLIYGPNKPELIEKYAFNVESKTNQITQNY